MLTHTLFFLATITSVLSCIDHTNYFPPQHNHSNHLSIRAEEGDTKDWSYPSFNWPEIRVEYALCHNGTQQSPIGLSHSQGHSKKITPVFDRYKKAKGELYNWNHGVAFNFYHPEGDFSGLPSMEIQGQGRATERVFLTGWHMHTPSEHMVDGVRTHAEMHFVHVNTNGTARAVIGVLIQAGTFDSPFFAQLPKPLIYFSNDSTVQNIEIDPYLAIREVKDYAKFWTYKGSYTTPPCTQGLQWFVSRDILYTSVRQMQEILGVGTYSAREIQQIWLHEVNA
ncbi:hypothetical protein LTR05_008439 [Lithohypha guttulata]|uniref:Alpha-carbonic anhydrase domain-containing protein n=1 Tax=Lithohypha guttulata TaxID=1690604 RepID=A0AAN7QCI8_9EURO|nr:hypothetical protein LTR05_008439 [Lithohypha guttulata]